jgi:hypothetical protein
MANSQPESKFWWWMMVLVLTFVIFLVLAWIGYLVQLKPGITGVVGTVVAYLIAVRLMRKCRPGS